MTDKDILISDLNDISEILNNNGYGGWCAKIRKAVDLLKDQEAAVPLTIDDAVSEIMNKHYKQLKEQEAVEPFHKCMSKEYTLIEDSHFDYCPYCGKPITWEGR